MASSEVTLTIPYDKKISRLFVFRFLWIFAAIWVMFAWAIWIAIVQVLHFFYMLVMGERYKTFWDMEVRFWRHCVRWNSYLKYYTNKRPNISVD